MATGLIAVLVALGLGASRGVADNLEFRGELNYETFAAAAARGARVRIKRSPGGTGAAAMMLARVNGLVIDGRCDSACAWAFVRNATACFTQRASFGFHGAHDPGTGRRMVAATKYWLDTVRPSLRKRLEPLLSHSRVIRLNFDEMSRHYPDRVCAPQGSQTATAKPAVPPLPQPAGPRARSRGMTASVPGKGSYSPARNAGG